MCDLGWLVVVQKFEFSNNRKHELVGNIDGNNYFFHGHKAATEAAAELTKLVVVEFSIVFCWSDDRDCVKLSLDEVFSGETSAGTSKLKVLGSVSQSASDSLFRSSSEPKSSRSLSLVYS